MLGVHWAGASWCQFAPKIMWLARSGSLWRRINVRSASHWRNLARAITFQWIPIGGLFAPFGATWWTLRADCSMQVARRKFQTFWNFLAANSIFGATTSQLGGSLSHCTPLGTLLATLAATANCIGANWHQVAPAQWTPSITNSLLLTWFWSELISFNSRNIYNLVWLPRGFKVN